MSKRLSLQYKMMNPQELIDKYYQKGTRLYEIYMSHAIDVTNKALRIAQEHPELGADVQFLEEASMLHDIGIFKTHAPKIACHGTYRYICHGYLGNELLIAEGLPKHGLVCERHTGTGLSIHTIIKRKLPIPHRDMRPQSIEEQIVCFADKFFSKSKLGKEKSIKKIRKKLSKHGNEQTKQFDAWCEMFL